MGFSINDFYFDQDPPDDPEKGLLEKILSLNGKSQAYCRSLIDEVLRLQPESLLTELLKHPDPCIRKFSVKALWELWYSEKGEEAREELLMGIRVLNQGRLEHALKWFESVHLRYPEWAEAINKVATTYFLLRRPHCSARLCRAVLEIKPAHFGAWNGLCHCAIQIGNGELAAEALRQYWKLCPHAQDAIDLDRAVRDLQSE